MFYSNCQKSWTFFGNYYTQEELDKMPESTRNSCIATKRERDAILTKWSNGDLDYDDFSDLRDSMALMSEDGARALLPEKTFDVWQKAMTKRDEKIFQEKLHEIGYDLCSAFWNTFTQMSDDEAMKLPKQVYDHWIIEKNAKEGNERQRRTNRR